MAILDWVMPALDRSGSLPKGARNPPGTIHLHPSAHFEEHQGRNGRGHGSGRGRLHCQAVRPARIAGAAARRQADHRSADGIAAGAGRTARAGQQGPADHAAEPVGDRRRLWSRSSRAATGTGARWESFCSTSTISRRSTIPTAISPATPFCGKRRHDFAATCGPTIRSAATAARSSWWCCPTAIWSRRPTKPSACGHGCIDAR